MLHIKNLDEGLNVFKALGSEVRVNIVKKLIENKEMNMNELASSLNITNGAVTSHVKKLEDCGIVQVYSRYTGHGNEKVCRVNVDKILIEIIDDNAFGLKDIYDAEVKVGLFSDYSVYPTCGISTAEAIIGEVDDPRYFAHSDRVDAQILWFTKGHVEYQIPNLLPVAQKIDQITLSVELSSEAPGINNEWPSDISFYLNGVCIGKWTSPGDFGDVKGIFTPDWWFPNWNQYGLLKLIVINKEGTFVDGLQISDVTIEDFDLDYRSTLKFKFAVEDSSQYVGGLTIFGKKFGNYGQDIKVRIKYSPIQSK